MRITLRIAKITAVVFLALLAATFVNYSVPSQDIVRIVGTEVVRTEVSGWRSTFWAEGGKGADAAGNKDIRFINTVLPSGKTKVFRNQDTRWCCPPYFKFDSGDLQAEAQGYASADSNKWVAVRHYGWRWPFLSIYPNATGIKPVTGPAQDGWYWPEIVWYVLSAILALAILRLWLILRKWVIDRTRWLRGEKTQASPRRN